MNANKTNKYIHLFKINFNYNNSHHRYVKGKPAINSHKIIKIMEAKINAKEDEQQFYVGDNVKYI